MKAAMITLLMTLFAFAGVAHAAPSESDLRKRFEERHPAIRELKQKGTVGETDAGYLVKDENDDRKALYTLIADKERTEPEVVAKRNAKRNFDRARDGEYLKEGGKWKKKGE